jgi:hypothetical protein
VRYSASRDLEWSIPTTQPGPLAAIVASATNKPVVVEIGFVLLNISGTTNIFGLGRPATAGVNPIDARQFTGQEEPANALGLTTLVSDWGTQPVTPAAYLRRQVVTSTLGTGLLWTFPRGLGLPVSGQLGFYFISAGGTSSGGGEFWAVIDE